MEESNEIEAVKLKVAASALFMLFFILLGILLTVLLLSVSFNQIYLFLGVFISAFFPAFIFKKQLRKNFMNKVVIKCSSGCISIDIYNRKTEELDRTEVIAFNQVKSFRIWISQKDNSCFLKVNFKNGSKISYTFLNDTKKVNNIMVEDALFKTFKNYNDSQNEDSHIYLIPNFFATKVGSFCIAVLTILIILTFIFEAIYKPKAIIFTMLGSGSLYLVIIAQRRQDLKDLDNFNIK